MQFIIKKEILLENLNNVSKALSSKNLIPVLSGIKFELTEQGLSLSASDTELSIKTFIDKKDIEKIIETGSIVIQGKYIVEIIRKLPSSNINIEVNDGFKVNISTSGSEFHLNGINSNEFPDLDLEENKEPIIINNKIFKQIINQTAFATSTQESRPLLTGLNFKIENNLLEVLATDSYRLAKRDYTLDISLANIINIVIPSRNLLELVKILTDDEENIEMHIFNNKVLFKYKNILFQTRLLNGTYPVTNNLIPESFLVEVDVNLNDFYNMIDRASLLTSEKEKNTIKLELKENLLIISSNQPEIGYVEEKLEVKNKDLLTISFSSKYMLEALKSFSGDDITLLFNTDINPIIIKSNSETSLTQLILPIKVY